MVIERYRYSTKADRHIYLPSFPSAFVSIPLIIHKFKDGVRGCGWRDDRSSAHVMFTPCNLNINQFTALLETTKARFSCNPVPPALWAE